MQWYVSPFPLLPLSIEDYAWYGCHSPCPFLCTVLPTTPILEAGVHYELYPLYGRVL
jgi:hypothetical protein